MITVRVDATRCSGHARCNIEAPDVFTLDEGGYNARRGETFEAGDGVEHAVRRAALSCPEHAITVS